MEGAAPVGQSNQKGPEEPLTDCTPASSLSQDVFRPPPYPSSIIPPYSSLSNSPDIPIKAECLSNPISLLFVLQGYSSPTSASNSISIITF